MKKELILILPVLLLLKGCAAAVIGSGSVIGTTAYAAHDRRTLGTLVEDESIELKSAKLFFEDETIKDSSHINVTSYKKIVLVTGETPTEEIRRRVIDIVRNIPEVQHVHDELTIAAPSSLVSRSADTLTTSKVKTKLIANKNIDATRVKVVTEKGVVYLMGIVTVSESDIATEVARQTSGVQKVVKLFQYIETE